MVNLQLQLARCELESIYWSSSAAEEVNRLQAVALTLRMSGRGKGKAGQLKAKISRASKAGISFPVGRVARYLKKGKYAERVGAGRSGQS